jgi:hypothetical protein
MSASMDVVNASTIRIATIEDQQDSDVKIGNSIVISWQPPDDPNGPILYYEIRRVKDGVVRRQNHLNK